ncbi:hypothetical protein ACFV6B_13250 [Streptomyces microflavus]|uniref:hypothetical protein n=1 Tax=Streptomyces microflavus TaxID=1919 RepID=UPI0036468756
MSNLFDAINEAVRNGTPLRPSRPYKRVPVREPRPLCLCGHPEVGHGSIDFSKPRCLNCRCDGFRDSGTTEDPDQIPYRLVDVPTDGDEMT